jgi:hypothetical protein
MPGETPSVDADALCAHCRPIPVALPHRPAASHRDNSGKPQTFCGDLANLPAALEPLTALPFWVLWKWVKKDGEWTKPPFQPNGRHAKNNDPSTWSTYDEVVAVIDQFDGIGFMLYDYCGAFDLDKVRDVATGAVVQWAQDLVAKSNTYAEISPSGKGLRIIGLAASGNVQKQWSIDSGTKLEAYRHTHRYVTVTGLQILGTPQQLNNIDAVVDEVYAEQEARRARTRRGGNGAAGAVEGEAAEGSPALTKEMVTLLKFADAGAGQPHGGYDDRSSLTYALVIKAVRRRVPYETIIAACLDEAYRGCAIFNHCRENGGREYVVRQIQHAREDLTTEDGFEADSRGRAISKSQRNVRRALKLLEVELKNDAFHDRILVDGFEDHTLVDDPTLEKMWLKVDERFRLQPPLDFFRIVVSDAARRKTFHPVRDYLNGLTWDGTERIDTWLTTYCGAENTDYVNAVGAIVLVAAVRRVRRPGCKFDEMVILESPQGTLKSELLATIAVLQDWFSDDLPLSADSKKVIEQTKGKWIVEAAEMSGMRRTDVEHLKATLSRQVDRSRLAFGRLTMEVPRQFVVVGTTNSAIYLKDLTGNRRFWPVKVANIDLDKLKADRDQLWAEAAAREAAGASIRLKPELWEAAAAQQLERTVHDPWFELLGETLRDPEGNDLNGKLLAADVWKIVGVDPEHRTQDQNNRLGNAMKALSFERKLLNFDGKPQKGYARGKQDQQETRILVAHNPPRPPIAALSQEELGRLIAQEGRENEPYY